MKPHKHRDLIIAWADGAEIEYRPVDHPDWHSNPYPTWDGPGEYRIKQQPKPDYERVFKLEANPVLGLRFSDCTNEVRNLGEQWICCTFDGETCRLKAVEII